VTASKDVPTPDPAAALNARESIPAPVYSPR